jgi:hypothetical protein
MGSFFYHSATTLVGQCPLGPTQRPLTDNIQHSQETDIHALGGIWTQILSKRAAIDTRLRSMGHCQTSIQEHECTRILNIMLDGDLLFTFKNLNLKRKISKLMILGFCTKSCYCTMAWQWPTFGVETSYQIIIDGTRTWSVWCKHPCTLWD